MGSAPASSLTSDGDHDKQTKFSLESRPLVASPPVSPHVSDAAPLLAGWPPDHLHFSSGSSLAQAFPHLGQDGKTSDYSLYEDIRNTSSLLDTRQWSSLPTLATTSGSYLPLTVVAPHCHAFPNGSFTPGIAPTLWMASEPSVIPYPQVIPNLDFSNTIIHNHTSRDTYHDHPAFLKNNTVASSSSSAPTEYTTNVISNERESSIVVYQPPQKNSSGRRRCQRACAVNIEGLWVDKDDLRTGVSQGSSKISVHECHWARSSNPCGMWIIGSRSRVGAHIRNWHRQNRTDTAGRCLWEGCPIGRAMLKDSINRHIVTVHLREGFHCQGCNQEFSRKDVYNQHVEDSEGCGDVGAAIVYGAERRVIDTRQALQQGGDVRYASR